MSQRPLPHWHSPEHVRQILLALPEKKRNRALYQLIDQFDYNYHHEPCATPVQLATLRLLWHDPRFQTLENLKHWLYNVLCSDPAHWLTLQTDILQLIDTLHPETCRTYGDFGGMHQPADILQAFVAQLFARATPAALGMAWDCLYWNAELRQLRPDWAQWLNDQIVHSKNQ